MALRKDGFTIHGRWMRKAATPRLETDPIARQKYDATAVTDKLVVERVAEIAANHGVPMAYIALTWLRHKTPSSRRSSGRQSSLTWKARLNH